MPPCRRGNGLAEIALPFVTRRCIFPAMNAAQTIVPVTPRASMAPVLLRSLGLLLLSGDRRAR